MSTSIVSIKHDGIEIYVDQSTGESFCSIRGYARMAGKDASTIQRRLQGVALSGTKTLEVQTPGGLQGVALLTELMIAKWLPLDNPSMAEKLLLLGVRKFLHTLVGYEHKQLALPSYTEALRQLADSLEREAANAPKVKLAESFIERDGLVMLGEFAKDLGVKGIGRNNLFRWMREQKYLQKNNEPYQRWVEAGLFVLRPSGVVNDREQFTTMLTAEGVSYFTSRLQ